MWGGNGDGEGMVEDYALMRGRCETKALVSKLVVRVGSPRVAGGGSETRCKMERCRYVGNPNDVWGFVLIGRLFCICGRWVMKR